MSAAKQVPEDLVSKITLMAYALSPHPLAKMLKPKIAKANYVFNERCEDGYIDEYYYQLNDYDEGTVMFRYNGPDADWDDGSPDLDYDDVLKTDEYKEFRANADLTTQFCHKFGLTDAYTGWLREGVMPWDFPIRTYDSD